jgi:hypothetical protein
MKHLVILAALLASPAAAQDSVDWQGFTVHLRLVEGRGAHVANIDIWNAHTFLMRITEAELVAGEVACRITVEHRSNPASDVVSAECATGYIAIPDVLDVEELAAGRIEVFRVADMVGM